MLKNAFLYMSESPRLQGMATRWEFSRRTARRFVAGEKLDEAIGAIRILNSKGFTVTMDNLGENVHTEQAAIAAGDEYLRILEAIQKSSVNSNVSLKLTQFGLALSEDLCHHNVERVVKRASELNNSVRIDMEGSPVTDVTLRIFTELRSRYENVGIVIQAYLFRSEKDIAELLKHGARIRLCKGAYKEPPEISFEKKSDTDANFVKLTQILLKSGLYHAIATHDPTMIQAAKEFAQKEKITSDKYEFQMLYGIRRDLQEQLIRDGYRVRIYVPYGTEWYSYLLLIFCECCW